MKMYIDKGETFLEEVYLDKDKLIFIQITKSSSFNLFVIIDKDNLIS